MKSMSCAVGEHMDARCPCTRSSPAGGSQHLVDGRSTRTNDPCMKTSPHRSAFVQSDMYSLTRTCPVFAHASPERIRSHTALRIAIAIVAIIVAIVVAIGVPPNRHAAIVDRSVSSPSSRHTLIHPPTHTHSITHPS